MLSLYNTNSCCGVDEISGIENYPDAPEQALKDLAIKYFDEPDHAAVIMFNGVIKEGYLEEFADLLKTLKLGAVVGTRAKINTNSDHKIRAFLWSVNYKAFKAWATAQGIETNRYIDMGDYDGW